jgi:hypothetical protein
VGSSVQRNGKPGIGHEYNDSDIFKVNLGALVIKAPSSALAASAVTEIHLAVKVWIVQT